MSISAVFGSRIGVIPGSPFGAGNGGAKMAPRTGLGENGGGLVIECSSRPQKKGTKHHMKTRPRKTQPWDIKRKPTVYPPLPPLPPEWTLLSSSSTTDVVVVQAEAEVPVSSSESPPPKTE